MIARLFPLLTATVVALSGCVSSVGDACKTSGECPSAAVCDNTAPDGYCLVEDCDRSSCPDGSVCIPFDDQTSYCMAYCEIDRNCRKGYVCRHDVGPAGYCYVAGTTS